MKTQLLEFQKFHEALETLRLSILTEIYKPPKVSLIQKLNTYRWVFFFRGKHLGWKYALRNRKKYPKGFF